MKQFRNKIMLTTTTVAIYGAISGSDDGDAFVYVVFITHKSENKTMDVKDQDL